MNDEVNPVPVSAPVAPVASTVAPVTPVTITANSVDDLSKKILEAQVVETLRTVYDPEIPVNIYELGLIYDVVVDAAGLVGVKMTLTSPACPSAQALPVEVRDKARGVPGVSDAKVEVVWDPPWTGDLMSAAAKLQMGLL